MVLTVILTAQLFEITHCRSLFSSHKDYEVSFLTIPQLNTQLSSRQEHHFTLIGIVSFHSWRYHRLLDLCRFYEEQM